MAEIDHSANRTLLEAVAFAARAHRSQLRWDGQTPYASHVFRVCLVVREVFAIDDRAALIAAVLHDTIEDTTTDFDDVEAKFGEQIARWVATLSKDKRLQEPEREAAYTDGLKRACWQVKVCKLADVYDNLMDAGCKPEKLPKAFKNAHRYLEAVKVDLPDEARRPYQIVSDLLTRMEAQASG